jgi:heat shock protein HslJ
VRISCFAGLVASISTSSTLAASSEFVARGNEPGWIVRKTDSEITFNPMEGAALTIAPVPTAEKTDGAEVYQASVGDQPFKLTITTKVCVDTMSGMPFPASVSVEIGGKTLTGCGGKPETLLHGNWTVRQIDGKPLVSGSEVSLAFGDDGMIAGNASCNRYFGKFTLTGESLTISSSGATRMMCDAHLMEQENHLLKILEATTRFEIGQDGSLILHAKDGATLAASR